MQLKKTVVINVVGLSPSLITQHTPFIKKRVESGNITTIDPVLPAVTCSAQSTYLTGAMPTEHGIVANGWYFRDEAEVKLWRQSNKLVQSEKIWEKARKLDSSFTCANMFWWYNMYSSVDFSATPRPMYPADGRKLPDVYTHPMDMREKLQTVLGQFPLFNFWGPNTNIKASQWIADASKKVEQWHDPTLTLIYLPHLDYNLQRHGVDFTKIAADLIEVDRVVEELVHFYEGRNAQVVLLSEYGITDVSRPVHLNRALRKEGYLTLKVDLGLEYLDAGASKAFAMADHQIAHIYVNDAADIPNVKRLLEAQEGVEKVLDVAGKKEAGLDHERSGELIAVADKDSWFTYYYWLDDAKAPDFARTVDIHRKPGYDPVEMFLDPSIKFPLVNVGYKLARKKLGFRQLMNVIPLDASLVKGSHGRIPEDTAFHPVLITDERTTLPATSMAPTDVMHFLLNLMQN